MSENPAEKSSSIFQNRFEWYQVYNFINKVSHTSWELSLRPEDIIHLGGTALFYRCYELFGPAAVTHFRGTRDMDLLSFRQGVVQQVIERMIGLPNSSIGGYSERTSYGLPNKKSLTLEFSRDKGLGGIRELEVDLYESGDGIRFNDRIMLPSKLILDPPERLSAVGTTTMVSVPSLRDAFVIKMDIVDYSRSGLRPKDRLDILTALEYCLQTGKNFDDLLWAMVTNSSRDSSLKKLLSLEELFINPNKDLKIPDGYLCTPDARVLTQAIKDVRRFRDYEIKKIVSTE